MNPFRFKETFFVTVMTFFCFTALSHASSNKTDCKNGKLIKGTVVSEERIYQQTVCMEDQFLSFVGGSISTDEKGNFEECQTFSGNFFSKIFSVNKSLHRYVVLKAKDSDRSTCTQYWLAHFFATATLDSLTESKVSSLVNE